MGTITEWVAAATIMAGTASVISLILVAVQIRSLARQTLEVARQAQSSTDAVRATIYLTAQERAIDIDRYFAERPQFREAFYGPVAGEGDQIELQRLEAIAEMLIDAFALVVSHRDLIPPSITEGWRVYLTGLMATSPQLADFWRRNKSWYPTISDFLEEHEIPHASADAAVRADLTGAAARTVRSRP